MINKLRKRSSQKSESLSKTKVSDDDTKEYEEMIVELSDDSITLYSTIQSIWQEYQQKVMNIPCLDLLSALSSQELSRKNS